MGLFSGSKRTTNTSTQHNTNFNLSGGSGDTFAAGGSLTVTQTDQGAIDAAEGIASDAFDTTQRVASDAFNFSEGVARDAFDYGAALTGDALNQVSGLAGEVTKLAEQSLFGSQQSVFDALGIAADTFDAALGISQRQADDATALAGGALSLARDRSQSEGSQQSESLIRLAMLGVAAVAAVFILGKS